ncbi:hypothetical protein ES707_08437 [subsurface metagenome]
MQKKRSPDENETGKEARAFNVYYELGQKRSLKETARILDKSLSLMKLYSRKNDWTEKVRLRDIADSVNEPGEIEPIAPLRSEPNLNTPEGLAKMLLERMPHASNADVARIIPMYLELSSKRDSGSWYPKFIFRDEPIPPRFSDELSVARTLEKYINEKPRRADGSALTCIILKYPYDENGEPIGGVKRSAPERSRRRPKQPGVDEIESDDDNGKKPKSMRSQQPKPEPKKKPRRGYPPDHDRSPPDEPEDEFTDEDEKQALKEIDELYPDVE